MSNQNARPAIPAVAPPVSRRAEAPAATALVTLVLGLLGAGGVHADPGDLDTAFASGGRLRAVLTGASIGSTISELPDGRLLVAGSTITTAGGEDFLLMRLTASGALDPAFGSGGSVAIDFRGFADVAYAHLRQPDGKLLMVGRSASAASAGAQTPNDYALLRLNADGTRDTGFGSDGRVIVDLGGVNEQLTDIELLPDGRILVVGFGGTVNATDAVFMRFTPNGAADPSFGSNGRVVVDGGNRSNAAVAAELQLDGRVVGCGYLDTVDNPLNADYWLVRLAADGSLDASFGNGGTVTKEFDGWRFENANACELLPDGRILVVGSSGNPGSADQGVVRFLADGRVDTTFGTAGLVRDSSSPRSDQLSSVEPQPDGGAFVAGVIDSDSNGVSNDPFVRRLGADGRFDPTFGVGGLAIVDFGYQDEPSQADAMSFTRQADGKLVTVGTSLGSPDALAVARLWPAGGNSPGMLGLVVTRATLPEAQGELVLTVRRTGGDTGAVSVGYATSAGTATAPADFTAVSGTLSWADGDNASKTIRFAVTNDATNESTEDLTLTLDNVAGGATLAAVTARITITDDDAVAAAPVAPGPAAGGGGGGGGGGGALGLGALALMAGLASRRRRVAT